MYKLILLIALSTTCYGQSYIQFTDTKGNVDSLVLRQILDDIDTNKVEKNDISYLKCKILTGTTPDTEGLSVDIAHGLDVSKIVSVTTIVYGGTGSVSVPHAYTGTSERLYNFAYDVTNVTILLSGTASGSLLSSPIKVVVWYTN